MPPAARKPCRRRAGRRQPYCCNISGRRRCQSSRNALACGSRAEMKRSYERRCAMTTVPVGMHRDDQRPQIQQAQKPVEGSQFLPNVAKSTERREHKLTRVAFAISRLMEFCSEKELVNQSGHNVEYWPLVILKELFDNALDAAEESEIPPEIEITVAEDGTITVADNANGIAAETIKAILDYTIRVSSREAYVSPTRGAQGNALKTILAMSYVIDRESDF